MSGRSTPLRTRVDRRDSAAESSSDLHRGRGSRPAFQEHAWVGDSVTETGGCQRGCHCSWLVNEPQWTGLIGHVPARFSGYVSD